ncbi:Protein kinase-like domain [Pseudocohnilembus persalinus]|uniref:non-specific serine/threonine protein kinase n=1 Tax=Pseudocohnilembus persalinus TaxID=266149 RepID=A0A0V0R5U1_PSEPJ|nr:Protein kinase-like domain [Pseudocohnilembus persalinus]|eukprot:KRX09722.1 Protein kinase-like domain [Pseudocohnilembus persalinus]
MYQNINQLQQQVQNGAGGSLQDFNFLNKIGEGSYSSVHKVIKKSDGKSYALKKVKLQGLKPKEKENALNEVRILASINHPNIISYKDTFFDEKSNSLCLVMEFAEEGDLQRQIDNNIKTRQHLPESKVWKILAHCLRGLQVLHGMKILHRDIKCANIFISKDGNFKLGDLNVSKVAKRGLVYTQTGTPYYASPEVWRDEPYDFKSDLWSLGCIIYELCALKPPFRAKNMEGLYQRVQRGVFERIPRTYSDELYGVIQLCLKVNPQMRPSCKQLLNNPLVKKNIQQFQNEEQQMEMNTVELNQNFNLLNTIKVPKNMKNLYEKLPKNKYDEEVTNQSLDNADLEDRGRNFNRNNNNGQGRKQKVASALPNYGNKPSNYQAPGNQNGVNNQRVSNIQSQKDILDQQQLHLQQLQLQQQKQQAQLQLPNIYDNQEQTNLNNNNRDYLPNIVNSPYNGQYKKPTKSNNSNNYHYIEGDQQLQQRKQMNNLDDMEGHLQRKEKYLLGGGYNQSQNNVKKYDIYNNNNNIINQANNYKQNIYQQQKKLYDNSNSRINNLYERNRREYLMGDDYSNYNNYNQQYNSNLPAGGVISHNKRNQQNSAFIPLSQQINSGYSQNSVRPVWWG